MASALDRLSRLTNFRAWARDADLEAQVGAHRSQTLGVAALLGLAYRSVGIIYGDIGTSPLYVYASTFLYGTPSTVDILGAASLIFWTLTLVVLLKYIFLVLFADDNGEGGTFALYSLCVRACNLAAFGSADASDRTLSRYSQRSGSGSARPCGGCGSRSGQVAKRLRHALEGSKLGRLVLLCAVLAMTSMVIGDGVLTPAISVLSAVGGINVNTSVSQDTVVGVAVAIIVGLFLLQRWGTSKVGFVFAPIVVLWLLSNAMIGAYNISTFMPSVFKAMSPSYAVLFFQNNGKLGWQMLSGIFLSITGCEALFADLGHFSRPAIQLSFSLLAYPTLVITYLGQAAWLTQHPEEVALTYYRSLPTPVYWPMFALATAAAVVASQAMITGAFSIVRQSIALGCFPRLKVLHTSKSVSGQVYLPAINLLLMVLTVAVVAGFRDATQIGNAYGIAVNTVMLGTTWLLTLVMVAVWEVPIWAALAFVLPFTAIEGVFLSANLNKVPTGGWFSLVIAAVFFVIEATWHQGTSLKLQKLARQKLQLSELVSLARPSPSRGPNARPRLVSAATSRPVVRLPGMALVYNESVFGVPLLFNELVTRWGVHEHVVFLTVREVGDLSSCPLVALKLSSSFPPSACWPPL